MIIGKKSSFFLSLAAVVALISGASPAQAATPILNGTLTVTVPGTSTPITLNDNGPSPAMTLTSIGVGLSGRGFGNTLLTRVEIHPSTGLSWAAGGWSFPASCPTTPTTTLSDCGVTGVFVNGVAISNLQVSGVASSNFYVPGMLQISSTSGNSMVTDIDMNGTVRVELAAGAWDLAAGAATNRGWVVQVLSSSAIQGNAYTTTNTVTFDGNGAVEADYFQTQNIGASAALSANQFTRSGYTFAGWATSQSDADAGTVAYTGGQSFTFSSSPTLYAVWTAIPTPVLSPQTQTPDNAKVGTPFTSSPMTATNFTSAVTYSVGPALPAGLTLDPQTGVISGTPTGASPATTYTITATGTDVLTATITFGVDEAGSDYDPALPNTGFRSEGLLAGLISAISLVALGVAIRARSVRKG